MVLQLHIDGPVFRDTKNREITLHGINVAGDAKNPFHPDVPSHVKEDFFDGDNVSFVGRPFPLDDAPTHFARLRRWGYNTIRYIFTWEALEHAGPKKYDEEFIQHTIALLRVAKQYGFYVFMDPHQDCWSRFTGGSGAPMWTIYACGLDPTKFAVTEAALVQNTWPDPITFPKMIWATSYTRLACQVIFTMFWAGRQYTPLAVIDGVNIQDYLQGHFIGACKHLATRIREAGDLDKEVVIGWESMNEPNRGMVGLQDLSIIPPDQQLKKGTSPTAWQAILTGSGRACEVEVWDFGGMGPYKSGKQLVDPKGETAWLSSSYDDSKYGWKRSPKWKLGECIWAQHGVWDPSTDTLLNNNYFAKDSSNGATIDYEYFTNHYFMNYFRGYRGAIRSVFPDTIMFCQPPVLELPPSLKGTADDDPNMVHAPHWYDGVTLMNKTWNRLYNVDVFGVLRHRYLTPAFAVKIGERAIRNCFRDQLSAIKKEGQDYMGVRPCVFTEIGVPYDMDKGAAYKNGDYTSQILAMDANHFGLEGSKSNFTLWNYTATNSHKWGDQWNGEDLSIYSLDDETLPTSSISRTTTSTSMESPVESETSSITSRTSKSMKRLVNKVDDGESGSFRAAQAYIRPTPISTHGDLQSSNFDLRGNEFKMAVKAKTPAAEDAPTEIFLPTYHFERGHFEVKVSGGKFDLNVDDHNGAIVQRLRWWNQPGEHSLSVKASSRREGMSLGKAEQEGALDQCLDKCAVM